MNSVSQNCVSGSTPLRRAFFAIWCERKPTKPASRSMPPVARNSQQTDPRISKSASIGILSQARRRPFPLRIIIERKYLLHAFGPIAAAGAQQFHRLGDAAQARVVGKAGRVLAPFDAIQDRGQVEDFTASFEEKRVQGFSRG